MGTLDSLFQGTAPPPANTTITDQTGLPAWYQQYLNSMASNAAGLATTESNAGLGNQGATVAPLADQTNQAITATSNLQGSQQPGMTQAQNYTNSIVPAASTASNTANGYGLTGAGAAVDAGSGANSLQSGAVGAANNAAGTATAATAGKTGTFTGNTVNQYLSPYLSNVVQGVTNSSNQNLFNNILPQVNGNFIGSGQFGSTRNADVLGQNINQYQTNLNTQISQLLNQGYTQAGQQFTQDQGQGLTQAQQAAQAALQGGQLQVNAGNNAATTALNAGQLQSTADQAAGNLALQGGQLQSTSAQAAGQQTGALTQMNNNMSLQNIGALSAAGQQVQNQNQNVANANQANAIAASNLPWQQLNNMSGLVRGQQLPTTTTGVSSGPAANYTASPLAQAVQALGLQSAGNAPAISH